MTSQDYASADTTDEENEDNEDSEAYGGRPERLSRRPSPETGVKSCDSEASH
jgi:hypothetical protein